VLQLVSQPPVVLQAKPPGQLAVVCAAHAPAPLQPAAVVRLPSVQLCSAHVVDAPGYAQLVLVPLQLPWHVPVPAQGAREPTGWPEGAALHAP